eukprot:gene37986-49788_t
MDPMDNEGPPGALPKEDLPRQAHCMRAGQQRGYFHRVLSGRLCVHHTNLQQVIWHKAWTGSRQAAPLYGSHAPLRANSRPTKDSPHYLYIDANAQCPRDPLHESSWPSVRSGSGGAARPPETADAHGAVICAEDPKGEAQTRKPDGQGLMACPPGLTADTTVFAIGRDAEMKVRMARRQGIASRGCLGTGMCCTLALNALGGRFRFVWRCLKSTGASTLPKSPAGLKSDSQ